MECEEKISPFHEGVDRIFYFFYKYYITIYSRLNTIIYSDLRIDIRYIVVIDDREFDVCDDSCAIENTIIDIQMVDDL